jgi:hypothetical protein
MAHRVGPALSPTAEEALMIAADPHDQTTYRSFWRAAGTPAMPATSLLGSDIG